MGNGENAGEVGGDRINCSNQPIAPFSILSPEPLIYNQHLQSRAPPAETAVSPGPAESQN